MHDRRTFAASNQTVFMAILAAVWLANVVATAAVEKAVGGGGPEATSNLGLTAPIDRWDEAVPLGNGLLGGLLWGGGQNLKLSLDRGDLWDLRTPETLLRKDWTWKTVQKLVAEKNYARREELFRKPYCTIPYPTKIPAGRLELTLDESQTARAFSLDLRTAVGSVSLASGTLEVFYSAVEPVVMIRITGPRPRWRIVTPDSLRKLDYVPAQSASDGESTWYVQQAALGLKYAVVVAGRPNGDATEVALTITSSRNGPDPLALGRKRVSEALDAGYDSLLRPHVAWWRRFWSQSSVRVPDAAVQRHYDLVRYFLGSASRRGAPPMPLQGVWTADTGDLPPWHGDYHHDANTELTYWAYLPAGHFDQGAAFLDFMWELLPVHRKYARDFFDAPGAAVPGVMALDGKAMGGGCQYCQAPTIGAWIAQAFYLHWRYTMDRKFLTERAYPYCSAMAECLRALLEPGADGKLKLPLSGSPEIYGNSPKAWMTPNSNHDLSLLRWLFGVVAEMAHDASDDAAAANWRNVLDQLDELAVEGEAGALKLSVDESLTESHRHHAHLMPIYPLGILTVEGSDRDRKIIRASLEQIDRLGTKQWIGFSFSWMACMAARCGDARRAKQYLDVFLKAFISRNGFNLNGDYKRLGYSNFSYRPFTLEGNLAAAQAVHEMLLQSWGGRLRIFPAVPEKWTDVSFHNLRAEGGFLVSARRKDGKTTEVLITSTVGGPLRLLSPWPRIRVRRGNHAKPLALKPDQRGIVQIDTRPGEQLRFELQKESST